ncbi:thioredoxin [Bacteroidales bacterium OttesenSCG-928-I14]|nr:thioredoxin [Bacteroidales bacterium OttesenSCG-928-I14]
MAMEINDSNFKELISGDKLVVVDFWAEWCGPCKMIAPFVDELATEYEGKAIIGKVNIENDDSQDLPIDYGVRSIPTLLFFKNGELVDKHVGATTKSALEDKIKSLL